jgi:tRNA(Ile)-lysidine synthase
MSVREFESISPALAHAIMRELIARGVGDLRKIERRHIDAMYRLAIRRNPSGSVALPRRWRLRREYDALVLERERPLGTGALPTADNPGMTLVPGANPLPASGAILTVREITERDPCFPAAPWHPPSRLEAYFDAAAAPVLLVRCFRQGDRIEPLGLCGSRKIHDVFVDHNLQVAERKRGALVVSGSRVVWVPGFVRSKAALVTPSSTKVLHLRADWFPCGPRVRLPEL